MAIYPENNAAKVSHYGLKYKIISDKYTDVSDNIIKTFDIIINNTGIRTGSYEISQMMIYPRLYGIAMSG